MIKRICIPETEYHERVKRAAELAARRGLDVLVVNEDMGL